MRASTSSIETASKQPAAGPLCAKPSDQAIAGAASGIAEILAKPDPTSETRVREIVASLDALPVNGQNHQFVQTLLGCAHYFQLSANSLRSVPLCITAVDAARRLGDRALLRKSLTFL